MDRLLYGTPTAGHPLPAYQNSMRVMEREVRSFGVRETQDFCFTTGPVHYARTRIARQAMDGRCFIEHEHDKKTCRPKAYDYILMHDDDLHVDPFGACGKRHEHDPVKCARRGNPLDVWHEMFKTDPSIGIIGAVYFREGPILPNVEMEHPKFPGECCHVLYGMPSEPFECAGVATGFMLIRGEALQAVADREVHMGDVPIFRFALRESMGSGYQVEEGEDYNFCRRVREAGYKVIADPRVQTTHCKPSGLLDYEHDAWEDCWNPRDPKTGELDDRRLEHIAAGVAEVRSRFAHDVELTVINGMTCLDHTKHRVAEIERWRERMAARQPKAA